MSTRAYRVNAIDREDDASFNLWHDKQLMDFFENAGVNFDADNGGLIEIPLETIKNALEQTKQLELDEWTINLLKADVAWAETGKQDYVTYECF